MNFQLSARIAGAKSLNLVIVLDVWIVMLISIPMVLKTIPQTDN